MFKNKMKLDYGKGSSKHARSACFSSVTATATAFVNRNVICIWQTLKLSLSEILVPKTSGRELFTYVSFGEISGIGDAFDNLGVPFFANKCWQAKRNLLNVSFVRNAKLSVSCQNFRIPKIFGWKIVAYLIPVRFSETNRTPETFHKTMKYCC